MGCGIPLSRKGFSSCYQCCVAFTNWLNDDRLASPFVVIAAVTGSTRSRCLASLQVFLVCPLDLRCQGAGSGALKHNREGDLVEYLEDSGGEH